MMRVQATPLLCQACGRKWVGELIMEAPADVVIASMKALHCPDCHVGWQRIAMTREPLEKTDYPR